MVKLNKIFGAEWRERLFVYWHLKKGDVFFDIGAGDGVYSKLAKKKGAIVHAFEPQDKIPVEGVTWNQLALDKESGIGKLYLNKSDQLTGLGNTKRGKIIGEKMVYKTTLDEYVEKAKIEKLDFIKLDVEGFEGRVLEGGKKTLSKFEPIILCELSRKNYKGLGYEIEDVKDYLYNKGFHFKQLKGFAPYNFVFEKTHKLDLCLDKCHFLQSEKYEQAKLKVAEEVYNAFMKYA